ncbi:MAG: chemotaxis protein CheA [Pelosinus sp.]|nr:chemotaxis protein CheA [Pelosinus sp.]
MSDDAYREPMLEMFIFESVQLIEQLEEEVLNNEKETGFSVESINKIFRIMHTIKSSSAMMLFKNISTLAHSAEDLFFFIREEKPAEFNHSRLTDIILSCIDYIKTELDEIQNGKREDSDATELINAVRVFLEELKGSTQAPKKEAPKQTEPQKFYIAAEKQPIAGAKSYQAIIFFEADCEMENVRAFTIVHHLQELASDIVYVPEDIIANAESAQVIQRDGFTIHFNSASSIEEIRSFFGQTAFLARLDLQEIPLAQIPAQAELADNVKMPEHLTKKPVKSESGSHLASFISVNVDKLDKLMDIVGELVIAEAMVTQNPELEGLPLSNYHKAARQLKKITSELQNIVMSTRMVSLAPTFRKMNRIVRDASKALAKEVELEIVGEETEVDKNIIENISDPLMHLIRNSVDHGIESPAERQDQGKPAAGKITLEAKNAGREVWIIVKDDGKGLDRAKILKKAWENGLTNKQEHELTDKEIYSYIFLPGFSTKDQVTELSGRGVGMDVVTKNIEKIGGSIQVDSTPGEGTVISIRIPLTLAIIDGMTIKVGHSRYTIPTTAIRESFRAKPGDVIIDTEGNEMTIIRGVCYPVLRLYDIYKINQAITDMYAGITIMVENNGKGFCIFADELLGQQQVVVKALPSYIKKVRGLAGCTLLGDGNISLILDVDGFMNAYL